MSKRYIHGFKNNACCNLIEHLREKGISATVGHDNKRNANATLTAYVEEESQYELIPDEWQTMPVVKKLKSELEAA